MEDCAANVEVHPKDFSRAQESLRQRTVIFQSQARSLIPSLVLIRAHRLS